MENVTNYVRERELNKTVTREIIEEYQSKQIEELRDPERGIEIIT
ncbi:MAG: hypothetical protein SVE93_02880 [Candidatus Thermoplasmatota archaeon]|nr:hypothetical protein [Candidatus Thermoplasmatota archaeon]